MPSIDEDITLNTMAPLQPACQLRELRQCVELALERLTPKQRDVVATLLLDPTPLTVASYAARVGSSPAAIYSLVRRARESLRRTLVNEFGIERGDSSFAM